MAHHSHGTAGSIEPHVICATCARNAKKYPHRFYSQAKGRGREQHVYTIAVPPEAYQWYVAHFGLTERDLNELINVAWAVLTDANPASKYRLPDRFIEWPWHARLANDLFDTMTEIAEAEDDTDVAPTEEVSAQVNALVDSVKAGE